VQQRQLDGVERYRFLCRTNRTLLPLEPKIRDPQARGIVAHHALDILRKALGGLGVDVERQLQLGAADAIQLAQDRLGYVADLPRPRGDSFTPKFRSPQGRS